LLPHYDPEEIFKVSLGDDGFIHIPKTNSNPCITERSGIFVAGTSAGPMDIVDSIVMSGSAAAEAAAYIQLIKETQTTNEREDVYA
jgi:heterodisulfide reductase subunit A